MKTCSKCKLALSFDNFHKDTTRKDNLYIQCKQCRKSRGKAYYSANKELCLAKVKQWRANNIGKCKEYKLLARYGLKIEDYNKMLESQNYACKICKTTDLTYQALAVDHDHTTGQIRGLLCTICNLMLGHIEAKAPIELALKLTLSDYLTYLNDF